MKAKSFLICVSFLLVFSLLATSSYAVIDPETCIGLWLFDEGSGNIAKDSSGNQNDGELVENPAWVDGKYGKALEFDGEASYVNCGDDKSLNIPTGGAVTMCVLVKSNVGSIASWQAVMAKRDGASYSYGINFMAGAFQIYTSGASGVQGFAYDLPAEEWVSICGTMSENPTELYVDGELFGTVGPGGGVSAVEANPLTIAESFGAAEAFGNAEIFNGIIDEVAVFDVVLNEDDIKDIATRGLGAATGLAAVDSAGKIATFWGNIKIKD
ncbi:hypothetical protein GF312_06770 [Candidatus Poribacteria bacterium]|nr:hypothetical protein [Candidatus Poribacteria bacterium]